MPSRQAARPARSPATGRRWRRVVITLSALALVVWGAGFLNFVDGIARASPASPPYADAVIVLTGGENRLSAGVRLLVDGRAGQLLVSGVSAGVTPARLQEMLTGDGHDVSREWFRCCIDLGFRARDTRGNAEESAEWVRDRGVRSLLLVTSNYHMSRSLIEFARALPGVRIEPYPVVADNIVLEDWWRWPASVRFLGQEYHKILYAQLRSTVLALTKG